MAMELPGIVDHIHRYITIFATIFQEKEVAIEQLLINRHLKRKKAATCAGRLRLFT